MQALAELKSGTVTPNEVWAGNGLPLIVNHVPKPAKCGKIHAIGNPTWVSLSEDGWLEYDWDCGCGPLRMWKVSR